LKISEVIAELEEIRKRHGDIPMVVARFDQGRYGWEEAGQVSSGYRYFQHAEDGGSYADFSAELTT